VALVPWRKADPALLVEESVTAIVQVDGKVRDRLEVSPKITADELEALARASAGGVARRRPRDRQRHRARPRARQHRDARLTCRLLLDSGRPSLSAAGAGALRDRMMRSPS
jgi:leucyl-tRNA synthetase